MKQLTDAEIERLAMLSEECGEVVQAVGKILRHGYDSQWNDGETNRHNLREEVGDIIAMLHIMSVHFDDFAPPTSGEIDAKIAKKYQFSHYQGQ